MNWDNIPEERLFQNNSKEEIMRWGKSLRYFHYMRSRGGHNCEGDTFSAYFKYDDLDDLNIKLSKIGVILSKIDENSVVFDPMKTYSFHDIDNLSITISRFNDTIQPQSVEIFGHKAHVWVLDNSFEISVSGTDKEYAYKVTEKDFQVCFKLEKQFDNLGWNQISDESIKYQPHCISIKIYPELFI